MCFEEVGVFDEPDGFLGGKPVMFIHLLFDFAHSMFNFILLFEWRVSLLMKETSRCRQDALLNAFYWLLSGLQLYPHLQIFIIRLRLLNRSI